MASLNKELKKLGRKLTGQNIESYKLNEIINEIADKIHLEVTDITAVPSNYLDTVQCGDVIIKRTGNMKHAYIVTYKEDGVGLCLTYHDASTVETIPYNYTDGKWVWDNSRDAANLTSLIN